MVTQQLLWSHLESFSHRIMTLELPSSMIVCLESPSPMIMTIYELGIVFIIVFSAPHNLHGNGGDDSDDGHDCH